MTDGSIPKIHKAIYLIMLIALFALSPARAQSQDGRPIADAGLSRYAVTDPVQLDGIGSYDPDNSGTLSYTWRQIAGPSVEVTDADTAMPTISGFGFIQTNEIQECEFELVVSDGELTSLPDTVKVIIVPASDEYLRELELKNDSFDPAKPTIIYFGGGGDENPGFAWSPFRVVPSNRSSSMDPAWLSKANIIECPRGYRCDSFTAPFTYYRCGDKIIVYLSAVAPNYKQPIQTVGHSWGGMPAMDVGIYLNQTYKDARYAVNRVTIIDSAPYRGQESYDISVSRFLASSVDGEHCWIDQYHADNRPLKFYSNILNVDCPNMGHGPVKYWYGESLTHDKMNQFNNGAAVGAYWSVAGPGKNLQLASTGDCTYVFKWPGTLLTQEEPIELYDEAKYPGRLPEPVTLAGPEDGAFVDANGALFTCEHSINAVGYQLLFGPDPHRVMDYYIISDTPNPPSEIVTASPFDPTWWTVKVYDQYGSTIYADPICVNFETLAPPMIKNLTTGQTYVIVQNAIDDAQHGDEVVVNPGIYNIDDINFQGKNLTLRSTEPNDSAIVATTILQGNSSKSVVTFSGGEDANCVLAGFTITNGKYGIYCSGASPTIVNCTITGNTNDDMGAGISLKNGSNPVLVNCTIINNSGSLMGGGLYNENSSPLLSNCVFSGNSAIYFGGGMYSFSGNPTITNCIVWDNIPDEMFLTGSTSVTYSDIKNGFAGEGNIDADPLFADPNKGDYHLKSQSGRWDQNSQSWVQDDVTSPCIDTGDPNSPVAFEPSPNGGIINMGAYGGTPEASKSP